MEPARATSHMGGNAASGSVRRPRFRNFDRDLSKGDEKHTLPIFDWRDGVVSGTRINYLRRAADVDEVLKTARGPFGFDVEAKPTFVKGQAESPIALLQLAREDQIHLIHLSAMREFPETLRDLLEDPAIVKAGVGIAGDAKKLWRDFGVSLLGAVELSHLARSADAPRWSTGKSHELISLTRLLEGYQSRRLSKGKVRMSNWELPLSPTQTNYAASDALAGFIVYQHLVKLDSQVPVGIYTSDFLQGRKEPIAKGQTHPSQSGYNGNSTIFNSSASVPAFPET